MGYPMGQWIINAVYKGAEDRATFEWTGAWYTDFALDRNIFIAGETVPLRGTVLPPSKVSLVVVEPSKQVIEKRESYIQRAMAAYSFSSRFQRMP
jgi:hypothetical protein